MLESTSNIIGRYAQTIEAGNKFIEKNKWCKNCYYCQDTAKPRVLCHRYPQKQYVERHYWCGEFRLKQKKERV